jgi:hypothetical protein
MTRIATLNPEITSATSKLTLAVFTKSIGFTFDLMATFGNSPFPFNAWATLLGSLSRALPMFDIPHFA